MEERNENRERYVKETVVSEITSLALPTLRNDRHLGRGIPFIRRGRTVRYDLRDVYAYMDARKVNTQN